MARFNSGNVLDYYSGENYELPIHDTTDFENESLGFPVSQKIPTDHFEFKHFNIVGPIGSGKTTFAEYFAGRALEQWGDNVDFFKLKDMFAAVEAIKSSSKMIHYGILDDFVSILDSRRSMGSNNVNMTQFYFTIRHKLREHAMKSGGKSGGLVILAILTQDHKAIDKRIREHAMFNVFKGYDKSCDELIPDLEVIDLLRDLKDRSVRLCDYKARQYAVGIDVKECYALFKVDINKIPKIRFKIVKSENNYNNQRGLLVSYMVNSFDLSSLTMSDMKAELLFKIDELETTADEVLVSSGDFSEILIRAKRIQKKQHEKDSGIVHVSSKDDLHNFFRNDRNSITQCIIEYLRFYGSGTSKKIADYVSSKSSRNWDTIKKALAARKGIVKYGELFTLRDSPDSVAIEKSLKNKKIKIE